jgi:hypothetical protein
MLTYDIKMNDSDPDYVTWLVRSICPDTGTTLVVHVADNNYGAYCFIQGVSHANDNHFVQGVIANANL